MHIAFFHFKYFDYYSLYYNDRRYMKFRATKRQVFTQRNYLSLKIEKLGPIR